MRTLASFRRYLLDHMVSLRHPDIVAEHMQLSITWILQKIEYEIQYAIIIMVI